MDPGLAAFLCSHHAPGDIVDSREAGCLFETLVLLQLQVMAETSRPRTRVYYWRTTSNVEVDFVLERGRRIVALEVKLSRTPRYGDTAGLREFLREYPEAVGVLVHSGSLVRRMGDRIVALPWHLLA